MAVKRELNPETIIGHLNEADTQIITSARGDRVATAWGRFELTEQTMCLVLADPVDVPDVLDPFIVRITNIRFDGKLCHALLTAYSETSDTIEVYVLTEDGGDLASEMPFETIEGSYGS